MLKRWTWSKDMGSSVDSHAAKGKAKTAAVAAVCLATAILGAWFLLPGKPLRDLQFTGDWNFGQHQYVSVVNVGPDDAMDVRICIRADYTYADAGYATNSVFYASIAPGSEVRVPYRHMKGEYGEDDYVDIGAMDIWIRCNRGKAHERWWVSYGMTSGDIMRDLLSSLCGLPKRGVALVREHIGRR